MADRLRVWELDARAIRSVMARKSGSVRLGYALSSEEHGPLDLVAQAQRAEESGFAFALISDHFQMGG